MTLKLHQLKPLFEALVALDGNPPHRFPAKVTWNKTKNIRVLRERLEELEKERQELIAPFIPAGETEVPKDRVPEYLAAFQAMLGSEEDLPKLLSLDPDGLNLYDPTTNPSGNVIPSSVLEAALPLIQDQVTET